MFLSSNNRDRLPKQFEKPDMLPGGRWQAPGPHPALEDALEAPSPSSGGGGGSEHFKMCAHPGALTAPTSFFKIRGVIAL